MRHRASGLLSNTGIVPLSGASSALGVRPEGVVVSDYLRGLFDASLIEGFEDGQRVGSWMNRGTADVELEFNQNDRGTWQRYVVAEGRPAIEFEDNYGAEGDKYGTEHLMLPNGEQNLILAFRPTGPDYSFNFKQGPLSYKRRNYYLRDGLMGTSIRGYHSGPRSEVRAPNLFDKRWHTARFHIEEGGTVNFWLDNKLVATDPDHGNDRAYADDRGHNVVRGREVQIAMIATAGHLTDLQLRDLNLRAEGKSAAGGWSLWLLIAALAGGTIYYAGRESKDEKAAQPKPQQTTTQTTEQ